MRTYPDTIDLTVTQEHIDNGVPGNPYSCPIALALRERYPEVDEIGVVYSNTLMNQGTKRLWYSHSPALRQFMGDFDDERPVHPTTVTLTRLS